MFKFEIIKNSDLRWRKYINESCLYDFYHTSFYHNIENFYDSILFIVQHEEDFIALPLVVRPIESTEYFDVTSVYGYAGPVASKSISEFSREFLNYFKMQFRKWCRDENIISAFSRLHPLMEQSDLFDALGEVVNINKTIFIDLRLSPEEQRRQYRKSLKSELNQLRRKGFTVEETSEREDIDRFIEIYYETMDRVNAAPHYYFSSDYFHQFLNSNRFRSRLLVMKHEGSIVAGAIFTNTDTIMQYHLAGTTKEYIKHAPMKLILDAARILGNELKLEYFHLGGGVGGSNDDSLFWFKSGFSKCHGQFSIWKYISNPEIYCHLARKEGLEKARTDFFPLYRSNVEFCVRERYS